MIYTLGGQYTFKIIKLHKQYSSIIRISPWELHISDPGFYDTIYVSSASGKRRDKYDWFTKSFSLDHSVFGTPQHDLHKMRRAALSPYVSMASVRRLQPVIQERIDLLLESWRDSETLGKYWCRVGLLPPLRMVNRIGKGSSWDYNTYVVDIVMMYCFGRCDKHLGK